MEFKSQLTCENGKEAPKVCKYMSSRVDVGKIKGLIRSDWPIMQMSHQVNDWKY